jgi:hypothetical protein
MEGDTYPILFAKSNRRSSTPVKVWTQLQAKPCWLGIFILTLPVPGGPCTSASSRIITSTTASD